MDRHRDLPHSTRGHLTGLNRDGRLLSEPERRPFKSCLHEARRPNPRRGRPPRGRAHGPVRASRASVLGPMIECRCADSEHCAAAFSRGHPSTEAEGLTMRRPQGSRRLSLAAAAAAAAARRARGRHSLRAIAGARAREGLFGLPRFDAAASNARGAARACAGRRAKRRQRPHILAQDSSSDATMCVSRGGCDRLAVVWD